MSGAGATSQKKPLRKIVVVFKTHFDLGFTELPGRVMAQYTGSMFDAVRQVMQATENEPVGLRYTWTLPAWPLYQFLHDPALPEETRAAAHRLVEEGRLVWHVWPFTTHTAFCGLEDLVRGLHISRSLSEEFGRWPIAAKQTDVPGHTWILPTLLVRAGIKFLHLGCNSGSHAPHVPRLFWWEGPDGSRLLTFYSAGGYGSPILPPDDWPFDTWLAVQQTVDNVGPQSPEELQRISEVVAQGAPGAELVFGQLGDFAESLLEHPEQLDIVPVLPYDLADTWIHGVGTMPREVARVRELRARLLALEAAAAFHDWPGSGHEGPSDFPLARQVAPLIDKAYEQLLLIGEHTWGLDVKSTIKRAFGEEFARARETEPYKRLESSWAAKAAYVDRSEAAYREAFTLASRAMGTAEQASEADEDAQLSRAARHIVEAGRDNVIEDHLYRVEVDPAAGRIVSLLDKMTGREWVDGAQPEPFGGLRYDLYSASDIADFMRHYGLFFQDWFVQDFGKAGYPEDMPHVTAYARDFRLAKSPDGDELTLSGGRLLTGNARLDALLPEQTISIRIALNPLYVDLEYRIEGKRATPLAESTVVPFPLNLPKPTFRLGQTGSVIDPARDIAAGANHELWCADWVDASDDRIGLAIYPIDMPLVSIGDTGIYRFVAERSFDAPLVYAHLSNTQWGTNFVQWLEGDFAFRIRLMAHPGAWRDGGLILADPRAVEYASELPHADKIEALLDRGLQGLELISIHPRRDGPGLIMRYWDRRGEPRRLKFQPGNAFNNPWLLRAVWRCDLMERPVERLEVSSERASPGTIELDIKPHAVETLLLEFATPGGKPVEGNPAGRDNG